MSEYDYYLEHTGGYFAPGEFRDIDPLLVAGWFPTHLFCADSPLDVAALEVMAGIDARYADEPSLSLTTEFGSLIWEDEQGNLVSLPAELLVRGKAENGGFILLDDLAVAAVVYDPTLSLGGNNFDWSRVRGIVHSHFGEASDIQGQAMSMQDRSALRYIAENGGDSSQLTNYIVGPDGTMRAFPLSISPGTYSGLAVIDCGG